MLQEYVEPSSPTVTRAGVTTGGGSCYLFVVLYWLIEK
jgi:hypothetical protein